LYGLTALAIAATALITTANPPGLSVWLLALLTAAICQGLLLPLRASLPVGLAIIVAWVLLRQTLGAGTLDEMLVGTAEVLLVAACTTIAARYRVGWRNLQGDMHRLSALAGIVNQTDDGSGLLSRDLGELRLREETDRAQAFQRPLGFLLVQMEPLPGASPGESTLAAEALARQVASLVNVHDIPFRVDADQIGVVLPERSWSEICQAVQAVQSAAREAIYWGSDGKPHPAHTQLGLHFGVGAYRGEAQTVDLLQSAQATLDADREGAPLDCTPGGTPVPLEQNGPGRGE
jgi:hypothetical protein